MLGAAPPPHPTTGPEACTGPPASMPKQAARVSASSLRAPAPSPPARCARLEPSTKGVVQQGQFMEFTTSATNTVIQHCVARVNRPATPAREESCPASQLMAVERTSIPPTVGAPDGEAPEGERRSTAILAALRQQTPGNSVMLADEIHCTTRPTPAHPSCGKSVADRVRHARGTRRVRAPEPDSGWEGAGVSRPRADAASRGGPRRMDAQTAAR